MPRLLTLKEAYASETGFTQALSRNQEWLQDLFDEVGFPYPSSASAVAEDTTDLGKRVDVVVYDDDIPSTVIECQDQTGSLDPIHAAKITYYMSANAVDKGILLCDTAPNEAKTYIREQNTHMPRDIAIVQVRFLEDKSPIFTTLEAPFDRKTRRVVTNNNARDEFLKSIQPFMRIAEKHDCVEPIAERDDIFVIKFSHKKWDGLNNIEIAPQKTKIRVMVPTKYNPQSIYPDKEWKMKSANISKGKVMETSFDLDTDLDCLIETLHTSVEKSFMDK